MKMLSTKMLNKWVSVIVILFLVDGFKGAHGLRVRLHPEEEPISPEVHNNYRMVMANPYFYYLKSAGLLNDSIIDQYHLEDYRDKTGKFVKGNFAFNSSEHFRKGFTLEWFVPWEEHTALQTYDDPRDRDLATGPQVDQNLCGLHLDYMLHLLEKYNTNLDNSTEYSMFMIMNTYDFPRLGVRQGNSHFLGDYAGCRELELNIMRRELAEVNRSAAESYFRSLADEKEPQKSWLLHTIRQHIGPFFGYLREPETISLYEYRDQIKPLPMRYCLNKLRWPSWRNSSYHLRNHAFKTAACLPETCDSNSLKLHYDKLWRLARSQMSDYYEGFYISDLFCLPDEQSELRNPFNYPSTVVFILFNGLWLGLVVLATVLGEPDKKGNSPKSPRWREFLVCWSLKKNIRDFAAAAPGDDPNKKQDENSCKQKELRLDTAPLEGFKVMSSLGVITAHSCIIGFGSVWNAQTGHAIISKGWLAMTNTICPAVVDNFFVVTGVITAKVLFSMRHKILMKPGFWLKFMLYRYTRIVPFYLFIHWFLQSVFRFLGDGPFWDYGTSHTAWAKLCQDESWWTIILPSANFKSPAVHCNGVGWYLANDMHFILVTPFVIILLMKKPLAGHLTVAFSLIALVANHIAYYLRTEQDIRSLFEINLMGITKVLDDASEGYTYPQYRFPSFLIGLATGHLLYLYECGTIKKWPNAFLKYGKAYLWFTIYLICFVPYISSLVPIDDPEFVRILGAIRDGTLHSIVSVASALFIVFLCTNQLKLFSVAYSWYIFRPLANASLCTLLIHIPLLFYYSQTMRSLPELTTYFMLTNTMAWAVQALLLSLVVHILYELPMRRFLVKFLVTVFADNKVGTVEKQDGGKKKTK